MLEKAQEQAKVSQKVEIRLLTWILIVLSWIWSIGVITGIAFGTHYLLNYIKELNGDDNFWLKMALAGYVTLIMWIVPRIFKMVAFVTYKGSRSNAQRKRLYQQLVQTVFLALTALLVILVNNHNFTIFGTCWENKIGQEMYRLLQTFFFGLVIFTFFLETLYKFAQPW